MIRTEDNQVKIHTKNDSYNINKRLYELENQLDSSFIRISKSTIVNINEIDYVAPSFKGIMFISLKNGLKDNISRNYLSEFKKRLGL